MGFGWRLLINKTLRYIPSVIATSQAPGYVDNLTGMKGFITTLAQNLLTFSLTSLIDIYSKDYGSTLIGIVALVNYKDDPRLKQAVNGFSKLLNLEELFPVYITGGMLSDVFWTEVLRKDVALGTYAIIGLYDLLCGIAWSLIIEDTLSNTNNYIYNIADEHNFYTTLANIINDLSTQFSLDHDELYRSAVDLGVYDNLANIINDLSTQFSLDHDELYRSAVELGIYDNLSDIISSIITLLDYDNFYMSAFELGIFNNFGDIINILSVLFEFNFYDSICDLQVPFPFSMPLTQPSPLVLDLNSDGIQSIYVNNGVYFDHNINSFAEKTAWINSFDAFLVRDINNNGIIDNGSEFFGDNTIISNGQKAINGFSALADLDSNGDNFIDPNDQAWIKLLLWQDKNTNGLTDPDELLTLSEVGIICINLSYSSSDYVDTNGNKHLQNSFFIREDGSTSGISDLWFLSDPMDSRYTQEIHISDNVINLIDFRGLGDVLSLHQTMSLDDSGLLISLLDQFTLSDPLSAKDLVWDIIYAWTGVMDQDPASRGPFIEDARKLYAMEKFWGQSFLSLSCGLVYQDNPHRKDANKLQIVFDDDDVKTPHWAGTNIF
jgi:hypothetical protein